MGALLHLLVAAGNGFAPIQTFEPRWVHSVWLLRGSVNDAGTSTKVYGASYHGTEATFLIGRKIVREPVTYPATIFWIDHPERDATP